MVTTQTFTGNAIFPQNISPQIQLNSTFSPLFSNEKKYDTESDESLQKFVSRGK